METKFSHRFLSYLSGQVKYFFQKKAKICILGANKACLGNDHDYHNIWWVGNFAWVLAPTCVSVGIRH